MSGVFQGSSAIVAVGQGGFTRLHGPQSGKHLVVFHNTSTQRILVLQSSVGLGVGIERGGSLASLVMISQSGTRGGGSLQGLKQLFQTHFSYPVFLPRKGIMRYIFIYLRSFERPFDTRLLVLSAQVSPFVVNTTFVHAAKALLLAHQLICGWGSESQATGKEGEKELHFFN
ncbi:hypothetical protein E4U58_003372 [Claviceps cyperi]|nr:hypothetical protein E4U58_003372 [Claviceps cyperi]